MLEKAAELPYKEFENKFLGQIMEPLADTILTKTVRGKDVKNLDK